MEDQLSTLNLKLPIPTLRKIQALALLSGKELGVIEDALSSHVATILDDVLKGEIAEVLDLAVPNPGINMQSNNPVEDENEHALSGDDDDGSDRSPVVETAAVPAGVAAPAAEAEEQEFRIRNQFQNVDNNADAFLDVALEKPASKKLGGEGKADFTYGGERAQKTTKSFYQPRVKIAEHTGEE